MAGSIEAEFHHPGKSGSEKVILDHLEEIPLQLVHRLIRSCLERDGPTVLEHGPFQYESQLGSYKKADTQRVASKAPHAHVIPEPRAWRKSSLWSE